MKPNRSVICKVNNLLKSKKISCLELAKKYFDKIKVSDLNAFVTLNEEEALNSAKLVDKKIASKQNIDVLEGVPFSLKDVISTRNLRTTCGSKILSNYVPIYNATCWEILREKGCVLLGKTNQDEFAMGSSSETSFFGPVKNPHNTSRVPGGSSGGSAACVSAGLSVFSIGSDTGGSIRQPAAFCGNVGFKPSYGCVSRYGLIPMASSFDQLGPMALTVEDVSLVFDSISRFDPKDSTTSRHIRRKSYDELDNDISHIKIGIPEECMKNIDKEIIDSINDSIHILKKLGAKVSYFSLPEIKYSMPIYYILMCAEASSNLARFDSIRYGFQPEKYDNIEDLIIKSRSEGFGDEVKRRILLGNYVLSSEFCSDSYEKAQKLREFLAFKFNSVFKDFDVVLLPTTPTTAFEFNYAQSDPVKMYLADICTVTANEIRVPAISIPCGYDKNNLPIGLQLMSARFEDNTLLNVAYKYECENFCAKIVGGVEI
ncbi:MAG: Asp-tRNA(Asn)/Glu-tRNA(Gln) amidotransferase subunit GatA [Candidatus Improbicoccus pseudotrichonymphae]|uniref:Glutamyl-tRNA(Gln) amidotransferase subunit A n=1 Tax=Candidatus Improbicoccus pseudotrichonymphae TaxID=3033792 RepID=A0AA48HVK4_9FIRM|nr:MAG: Asp-tRNA(Asn)/Glu-tRNA(Gln) amidotransferase subunit GatA [Candidatus Improbicoccus pseudotrichonymphae]